MPQSSKVLLRYETFCATHPTHAARAEGIRNESRKREHLSGSLLLDMPATRKHQSNYRAFSVQLSYSTQSQTTKNLALLHSTNLSHISTRILGKSQDRQGV